MTSMPFWNLMPWTTFGNWFSPFNRRHVLAAAVTSLNTMSLAALVLALPLGRQSGNHRWRQVWRVLAQECRQRLLEVARRDAPQVEYRQQRVQALRPPRPQRQDCRGEPNPLAGARRPAIPDLHPGDLHRPDSRLDRSRGAVTVPHQAISAIGKLQLLHRGEEYLRLHLDSLRKKLPRTKSQDIGQWIVNLVGLTQRDNLAILVHGVSLSSRGSGRLETRLDTPPISPRHHPLFRITQGLKFRRLPVINKNRRMIGILSLGDVSRSAPGVLLAECIKSVSAHHH